MKPIVEQYEGKKYLKIFYISIFVICILCIGAAVYLQFNQGKETRNLPNENQTQEDIEPEDEYNALKAEFSSLFTNNLDISQNSLIEIQKLNDNFDYIVTAYTYDKMSDNVILKAYIPYFNIKKEKALELNKRIGQKFKSKAEEINSLEEESENTIYTVTYKAYLQNNILSLVIRSELKEGTKSQKIEIQTYNYNIIEDKEVTLQELLTLKSIKDSEAEFKITNEIMEIQKQNEAFAQALAEQGSLFKRDYTSDIYKLENTEQYFLGKDGMLYILYPYGNNYNTSEIDIVIFK